MQQDLVHAIKSNPKYHEMVSKRATVSWLLAIAMLAIYYGFILIIAFAPKLLATPLSTGAVTTIGMPIGVAIIVSAFVLTGIYVARANGKFDALTKAIREDLQ